MVLHVARRGSEKHGRVLLAVRNRPGPSSAALREAQCGQGCHHARDRHRGHRAAAQPLLALQVDATEGKNTSRIAWIASLQCQVTRSRSGRVAQSWATSLAARWGKSVERQRC